MFVFHTFLIILIIAGEKIASSSLNGVAKKKDGSSSTLNILWRGHHPVVLMVSKETVHLEYQIIESAINKEQTLLFFIFSCCCINYYCSLRLSYSYSYS
jgi:hypothetical protein